MNQTRFTLIWVLLSSLLLLTACRKTAEPVSEAPDRDFPALSENELQQKQQTRLAWNLKTLIEPYEKAGFTNPLWDTAAKLALTEFARAHSNVLDKNELWAQIISTNASAAVQSGCKDPMVTYLYIKFAMDQTNSKAVFSDAFVNMARAMNKSSYPSIRKYYAAIRCLDQLFYTYSTNSQNIPEVLEISPLVGQHLIPTLQDKTMPAVEAYEASQEALKELNWNEKDYAHSYSCVEKPIFENWPNEYTSWLLKGEAYIQMGWNARGGGFANSVTDAGAKTFATDLTIADQALNRAWTLNPKDPKIALKMISVELGQGLGRDRMEKWFNRAMEVDHNNYDACNAKLLYIEPKWYGSVNEMLSFGRLCVNNTNWGGRVPIVLVDAHLSISQQYINKSSPADYWKRPEVWEDIQSAYNRCLQINPTATDLYYYYVKFAYQAEDWARLKELIPKLGDGINYDFFGGKDKFTQMVNLDNEHTGDTK